MYFIEITMRYMRWQGLFLTFVTQQPLDLGQFRFHTGDFGLQFINFSLQGGRILWGLHIYKRLHAALGGAAAWQARDATQSLGIINLTIPKGGHKRQ